MNGRTHVAAGLFTSLLLLQPKDPIPFAAMTAFAAAGSVFPDIDHTESKLHKAVSRFLLAMNVVLFAVMIAQNVLGASVPWEKMTFGLSQGQLTGLAGFVMLGVFGYGQPHRGFTHSVMALMAFTYAVWSVYPFGGYAFGMGYLTHIMLDCLNRKGLQVLWPSGKRWSIKACSANGRTDKALFVLFTAGFVIYAACCSGKGLLHALTANIR